MVEGSVLNGSRRLEQSYYAFYYVFYFYAIKIVYYFMLRLIASYLK